jgi:hypothetical protein
MALALATVEDYVADARVLLQDVIAPYRYTDPELCTALNVTLLDVLRLRADLYLGDGTTTDFGGVDAFLVSDSTPVDIEAPFRLAVVFGMCAHALARDQEDVQDQRSQAYMALFTAKLTTNKV